MPQNNDQKPTIESEDHLVLRKVTGRKRKFDDPELKKHFVNYFSSRLTSDRLAKFNEATIDFANCNFNSISYELLSNTEYKSWNKCWSSYKARNFGDKKYLHYFSKNTHDIIKQLSEMPQFKGDSIDKIIVKLGMQEIHKSVD